MPLLPWPDIYGRLARDRNDAQAYSALMQRARAYAREDLGQHGWHVVEDAVMDTCAAVLVSFADARGPETFKGFVLGHYFNARRAALRGLPPPSTTLDAIELTQDELAVPDPDDMEALGHCLSSLPERQGRAVRMRFLEGASGPEIAAVLKTSAVNARQLVFDGLRRLRDCLSKFRPGGR